MAPPSVDAPKRRAGTLAASLKDASGTALLALALSFPILALRTD